MFGEFDETVRELVVRTEKRAAAGEGAALGDEDEELVEESVEPEAAAASQAKGKRTRAAAMKEALSASIEEPVFGAAAQPKPVSPGQGAKKRRLPNSAAGEPVAAAVAVAVADGSAAGKTAQARLKRALKEAAAKHKLTFKQVRS